MQHLVGDGMQEGRAPALGMTGNASERHVEREREKIERNNTEMERDERMQGQPCQQSLKNEKYKKRLCGLLPGLLLGKADASVTWSDLRDVIKYRVLLC